MNELPFAIKAIHNQLSEYAPLVSLVGNRIHYGVAPEGAVFPCVVYSHVAGQDTVLANGIRIAARPIFLVKAISKGQSPLDASTVAIETEAALTDINRNVPIGGRTVNVRDCVRNEPASLTERKDGVTYQHIGGYYQFFVEEE